MGKPGVKCNGLDKRLRRACLEQEMCVVQALARQKLVWRTLELELKSKLQTPDTAICGSGNLSDRDRIRQMFHYERAGTANLS